MTAQLAPVTHDRIAATLDALNLQYYREDGEVRTAFPALAVFFEVEPQGFKATARWMATLTEEGDIQLLRRKANELNRALPLVRTHPVVRPDETAVCVVEAPFFASDGFTDEQVRQMLEYFFSIIHHVAEEMRTTFPHIEELVPTSEGE